MRDSEKATTMFKNNQKREFPLSARYKTANGKVDGNVEAGSTSSRMNNSPTMPVKFEQPVKLTSILSSPTDTRKAVTSNATQDLNKAENLAQLISYKLVSDIKKPPPAETKEGNGVNVYSIQPPKTTDTLDTLSTIEKCITQMEAKAIQQKNIQKFLELCKSIKPDAKTDSKDKSQTSVVPPSVPPNQPPLKSFNEVENLLKPGVSDMEAEYTETFDRAAKTRSSTSGAERAAIKTKPLSRTVSDAQEHKPVTERVAKPKPRLARNVSQVCAVFLLLPCGRGGGGKLTVNTRAVFFFCNSVQEMKNFVFLVER